MEPTERDRELAGKAIAGNYYTTGSADWLAMQIRVVEAVAHAREEGRREGLEEAAAEVSLCSCVNPDAQRYLRERIRALMEV